MSAIQMFRMGLAVSLLLVRYGIGSNGPAVLSVQEEEALKATILDDTAVLDDPADFQMRVESLDRYVRLGDRPSQAWLLQQIERFPPQAALYRVVLRDIRAQPGEIRRPGAPPGTERRSRAVINAVIEIEMFRMVTKLGTEDAFRSLINLAAREEMPFEIRIEAARQGQYMLDAARGKYRSRYARLNDRLRDEIIEESLAKLEQTSVTLSKANRIGLEEYKDASLETAIESTRKALQAAKGKRKPLPPIIFHEIGAEPSEK